MIRAKIVRKSSSQSLLLVVYMLCICFLCMSAFAETPTTGGNVFRITQTEAEQRISLALSEQDLGENLRVSILGRRSEDLIQKSEPIVMEVADLKTDTVNSRFIATLEFSTEAGVDKPAARLGNLQVTGRFDNMQEVPVVKFRITPGTIVKEEDIAWQKMPSGRLAHETVLNAEDIIGKTPIRALVAGRPIKTADLRTPPVVIRQSNVHMHYKNKNIVIEALGQALEDGAVGDKIRLRNISSGVNLEGIVTAVGQVQVIPVRYATKVAVAHVPGTAFE